jgi:heat-inducible transcriptional repressor
MESISSIYDDLRRVAQNKQQQEAFSAVMTALEVIDTIIEENIEDEMYWEGLNYFMDEPEFRDINITRNMLKIFSDKKELVSMMRGELPYEGLRIYIGKENRSRMLKDCSMITCGYSLRGRPVGRIGVIGPTRMDYDHALRTVSCLSYLISEKLKKING